MAYAARRADMEDWEKICSLYASAREFMAKAGNPSQWGKTNPREETLKEDISRGNLYVLEDAAGIHGVFAFIRWEDPTYGYIEGSWHSDRPYGVIHRVAGDGSGGILKAAVTYAEKEVSYLRIDTHRDNKPMQRAIARLGFAPCGVIYTEDGSPRLAYDRIGDFSE